ncbi:MAG: hypothetical protein H6831_05110 [Planctomycetes bacterium]|nr:hypothetical protein [Planctomycetota bacterium]MCB9903768.1 hypothetical protein [Planctomycetota bacterium]
MSRILMSAIPLALLAGIALGGITGPPAYSGETGPNSGAWNFEKDDGTSAGTGSFSQPAGENPRLDGAGRVYHREAPPAGNGEYEDDKDSRKTLCIAYVNGDFLFEHNFNGEKMYSGTLKQ